MIEYIDLTIDFTNRNSQVGGITLDRVTTRSYDTAIKFRIEVVGYALDDTYDVKILSNYSYNQSQALHNMGDNLEFLDGKLIYTPKLDLISQADFVKNYLYITKDGLSLDVAQFNYGVDLSEIDKTALEVKLVYDESYETLITEFEQELEDYKLTLPQASELRAEIDTILNQAVADWEQGADALLETVEGNESARVDAEATRKTDETDRVSSESTRKTNETTRISNEAERKSSEVIRLASEVDRVNAENVRAEFYEGFESELGKKANKQQEDWITPTLLNGWADYTNSPVRYMKDEFGIVHFRGRLNPATKTDRNFMAMPAGYSPARDAYFNFGDGAFIYFGRTGPCQSYFDTWQSLEGVSFSTI